MLPHYLLGLSQFVEKEQHASESHSFTQRTAPSRMRTDGEAATRMQAMRLQHSPMNVPQSGAVSSTVVSTATQARAASKPYRTVAPPRSLQVAANAGTGHAAPVPGRSSFCGDPPPEAAAFGGRSNPFAHHDVDNCGEANVRKSSFFSRGRTEASRPVHKTRRSRTFDLGYRHSEMVGVPAARGLWGEPQAIPGPGGAFSHPGAQQDAVSKAQADSVAQLRTHTELPAHGKDLAAEGMLEFEEMMARRVRLFSGAVGGSTPPWPAGSSIPQAKSGPNMHK
jgi:hypothetical protein